MPFPLFFHRLLTFGRRSEILGIDYLRSQGLRIVATGYRTPRGEVDVIAWDGNVLAFIEVKSRRTEEAPEDSVGFEKQRRITLAAETFMVRHHLHDSAYRFDILAITCRRGARPQFRYLRDAFNSRNDIPGRTR